MRLLLSFVLCVMLAMTGLRGKAFGQGGDLSASLRSTVKQIKVGDEAEVILEAAHDPAQGAIAWPQIPDSFGKLEVHSRSKIDTVRTGGAEIFRQRFTVTGFDSGVFTIPPFTITAGSGISASTAPLDLLVQTLPVDTTKPIKPIKDIIAVPRVWTDSWPLIIGGLALILAIILIAIYLRRRKKKPVIVAPPPPKISPHLAAIEALKKLEAEAIWQRGEVKEYYVQLTGILRQYIEAAWHEPALESTTDELLNGIRRHPILMRGYAQMQSVLPMADLAKFAKAAPTAEDHHAAMQSAISFVQLTTPAAAAEDTEGGVQK